MGLSIIQALVIVIICNSQSAATTIHIFTKFISGLAKFESNLPEIVEVAYF